MVNLEPLLEGVCMLAGPEAYRGILRDEKSSDPEIHITDCLVYSIMEPEESRGSNESPLMPEAVPSWESTL
jgi:hypothetical protein